MKKGLSSVKTKIYSALSHNDNIRLALTENLDSDGIFDSITPPLNFNTTYYAKAYFLLKETQKPIYTDFISFEIGDGWGKSEVKLSGFHQGIGVMVGTKAYFGLGCRGK